MIDGYDLALRWLEMERCIYQVGKFDYEKEKDKPVEYWIQQFDSYIQRLPVFGLDTPQGHQAALKLCATTLALCEHLCDKIVPPRPGVSSGTIEEWIAGELHKSKG